MTKKLFTFVLMPFDSAFDDIYKLGIKETCENLDVYCERVDEQIYDEKILDRIYNQINKADIVIADMTGKNPNVFYETGYAHALNKKVILLTQKADDIPFDLKHYHHIVYDGKIIKLKEELAKRVAWIKDHPNKKQLPNDFELELFINGIKLDPNVKIHLKQHYAYSVGKNNSKSALQLKIDIHNKGIGVFDSIIKIGAVTEFFNRNNQGNVVQLNDKEYLHISNDITRIFPSDWMSVEFILLSDTLDRDFDTQEFNMTVKIFSELGVKDIPISISHQLHWEEI